MQRVAIIGSPGSGKSTLAQKLSRQLGLPLHHLDRIFWRPNWIAMPRPEFDAELHRLTQMDRWIIDGNYNRTLPIRMAAADTIVFLDFPTSLCFGRVLRRTFRGTERPDMGEGCPEQPFRWEYLEFLHFVLSFPRHSRPRIMELIREHRPGKRVFHLRSPASVKEFLKDFL